MITQICENMYSIPVALPNNPLKWLNAYFAAGNGKSRNLLVDTGFNNPECLAALTEALFELKAEPADTDVFLTHLHSDHTGNAAALEAMGCRIIMGEHDYKLLAGENWAAIRARALSEGMSREMLRVIFDCNPATIYAPDKFHVSAVNAGDILKYGGYEFECICTPGHTPGHMCLYDRGRKLLLSGDHVLFDISPNITCWSGVPDSLGDYLESLRRVEELEVETVLPGHRNCGSVTLKERTEQLIAHHERRLGELERIIAERPGLNAYELTGLLRWRIHAKSWDDFPPAQKWFAMGEAMAHLDYLIARGRIRAGSDPSSGCRIYFTD